MRIAQVAPLYEAVPPGRYGGTERVIATLCDGLVRMGHDVTLFAPRTSETAAALEAYEDPLRERLGCELLVTLAPHLHRDAMCGGYLDVYEKVARASAVPRVPRQTLHLNTAPTPAVT